jgi:dephospho-CoA kinase
MKVDARPSKSRRCLDRPIVIGLTGPIASGKSRVAEMLRRHGAEVIDADAIYHSLVTNDPSLRAEIASRFGPDVFRSDGALDRAKLGSVVFSDPMALADLDRLTHPPVVEEIRKQIGRTTAPVVAIEAIKLLQSGLGADVDALWLVTADPEIRTARLMERNGLDAATARARVAGAGVPLPGNVEPDVTIHNNGEIAAASRAVDDAWQMLVESACNTLPSSVTKEESR